MDISTATTLASGLVALIAPALVQTFKTYIPSGYVGLVSLAVSILFGVIAIAATGGFDDTYKTLLEITSNELQSWVNKLSKGGYKAQLSGKKKPRPLSPCIASSRSSWRRCSNTPSPTSGSGEPGQAGHHTADCVQGRGHGVPHRAGSRTAGAIPRLHRRAHQRSARPADSGSRLQEPQSPHPPHMVR